MVLQKPVQVTVPARTPEDLDSPSIAFGPTSQLMILVAGVVENWSAA